MLYLLQSPDTQFSRIKADKPKRQMFGFVIRIHHPVLPVSTTAPPAPGLSWQAAGCVVLLCALNVWTL